MMGCKENENVCDTCEKPYADGDQSYEYGDGETGYICLDCYTSLIDDAMDMHDQGDWPPRGTPEPR